MKTTKKVNMFCFWIYLVAIFAALVLLTGCPSPVNPGNGGGGNNGGGIFEEYVFSWKTLPTWTTAGVMTVTSNDTNGNVMSSKDVDLFALGDPWKIDSTKLTPDANKVIGTDWYLEKTKSLLAAEGINLTIDEIKTAWQTVTSNTFISTGSIDTNMNAITSPEGLGFGVNGSNQLQYAQKPSSDVPSQTAFASVKEGLEARWTNAKAEYGTLIFANANGHTQSASGYLWMGEYYMLKVSQNLAYTYDYEVYYNTNANADSVFDVTVVITNGAYTYAFVPDVKTIAAFSPPPANPSTTLSDLMMEETGMTLTDAKSALAELTGYDIYFVVKARAPGGSNLNGIDEFSYRNVIKVTPDP